MSFNEVYHKIIASGAHVGSHESDMYVDDNLHVRNILEQEGIPVRNKNDRWGEAASSPFLAVPFRDQTNGAPSLDVALYFQRDQAEVRFHSALETELYGMNNQKPAGFYNVFEALRTKHPEFQASVIDDVVESVTRDTRGEYPDTPVSVGIAASALATMLVHGREFSDTFMQTFSDKIRSGALRAQNGEQIVKEAGDIYHAIAQSLSVEDFLSMTPTKTQEADHTKEAGKKSPKTPEPGM